MTLSKNWVLRIDPTVFKFLKNIPRPSAEAILEVIHLLPINPFVGDIQKMKGEDFAWRRRVGSYRIYFKMKIAEEIILVSHVERRTSTTYRKKH